MRQSFLRARTLGLVTLFAASLALAACEEEGPAEQAGEEMDNAAEEAGDAVEDSTDSK